MSAPKLVLMLGAGFALIVAIAVLRPRRVDPASAPPPAARTSTPDPVSEAKPVEVRTDAPSETIIRGVVLDGRTKKPIAGVRLAFHRPRSARPGEVLAQSLQAYYRKGHGTHTVGGFIKYGQGDRAYDRPEPGEPSLAEVAANVAGEFEATVPLPNVIVECGHPGYATLYGPYFFDSIQGRKITIHLHPAVLVRGRVVRVDGEPVRHKLRLALLGDRDPHNWIGGGSWETVTSDSGDFSVEVGAPRIFPKIQELGWRIVSPQEPVEAAPGMSLEIRARRTPLLVVTDAASRAPVEKFSVLLGRAGALGNWMRGEVSAPQGRHALLYDSIDETYYRGAFKLQVWAEGFAEFERDIPDLLVSEDIEAALVRGSPPTVTGFVRRKGEAVKGAQATLNSGFLNSNGWKPDQLAAVSATVTGEDGGFKLVAPSGSYILIVRSETVVHAQSVIVPANSLVVDLEELAEVQVRVRNSQGGALPGIVVLLQVESNRRWYSTTDAGGVGRFTSIPPGLVWIAAGTVYNPGANEYTNNNAPWVQVQAAPGGVTNADLTVEPKKSPQPLATRLSIRGATSLEGWKITDMNSSQELSLNDQDQLMLSSRSSGLRIESPWGDTWWIHAPEDVGTAWNVDFDPQGMGLDGIVTDLRTGKPLADVSIQAGGERTLQSKSDANGRFRLRGLTPDAYKLSFGRLDEYSCGFEPFALPSPDPPQLRVAIPRMIDKQVVEGFPNRKISGRLLNSATSTPYAQATIFSQAAVKVAEGVLVLHVQGTTTNTDSNGFYTLVLPLTPQVRAQFVTRLGPESQLYKREWTETAPGDVVLDFKFP